MYKIIRTFYEHFKQYKFSIVFLFQLKFTKCYFFTFYSVENNQSFTENCKIKSNKLKTSL